MLSEIPPEPHERFFTENDHFHRTDSFPGSKAWTTVAVRKSIPHTYTDLPPLVSVEATGVCIPIGNSEILLAALCKSLGVTQTPLSYQDLEMNLYWEMMCRLKTLCGIVKVQICQERTYWHYSITISFTFQHHNDEALGIVLTALHRNARLSDTTASWIQTTYHSSTAYWIILGLKIT
jgi:hypothetical protein